MVKHIKLPTIYSTGMSELEKILTAGDVIVIEGKTPLVSGGIKLITNSQWSHSSMCIGDNYTIESDWGGVQINHIRKFNRYNYCVYRHKQATVSDIEEAIEWSKKQIGKRYDFWGMFGIVFSKLRPIKDNKLDDKNLYWCSELIADAYRIAGLEVCDGKETWEISPADFARSEDFSKIYEGNQ